MKKFYVRDGENEFEVEESEVVEPASTETVEENDAESLSEDDIKALKSLAAIAPQLAALVKKPDATDDGNPDEENPDDVDCVDEDTEEVIETEPKPTHDSKKSFGAMQKKKKQQVDDSVVDEVADAWAKRYGGNK